MNERLRKKIDRMPPNKSGDPQADAIIDYLVYLRSEINFILSQIYKNRGNANG